METDSVTLSIGPIQNMAKVYALMDWNDRNGAIGHLVYIAIPMIYTFLAVMYLFRYGSKSNYYDRFVADSTQSIDWFKYGDYI